MTFADLPEIGAQDRQAAMAATLNSGCECISLDREALRVALAEDLHDAASLAAPGVGPGGLFSDVALFVPDTELSAMAAIVRSIETVAALPAYRSAALENAPEIARFAPGPLGALMGYDFHLTPDGPRLIEVNTNAGGAFLNARLLAAQRACCAMVEPAMTPAVSADPETALVDMFRREWARQRGAAPLTRVAIVDEDPPRQYLHADMRLAAAMLQRHGIDATIVDPAQLRYAEGRLFADDAPVDLVYNRLTDFMLEQPAHAALRAAYLDGAVVLTPHPHAHASLADKRNLVLFSDPERLRAFGADEADVARLHRGVPRTIAVDADNAERVWAERKSLFFKPACGYGSKAAYRGDKLTRGVWSSIATGGYVAQAIAAPGERVVRVDGERAPLKTDVRLYTYAGEPLLAAARLYRGQTTNFRTPGGGFAPVFRT
ncbi:MAG: hypothetical protein ACOY82_13105 [Pseudomonadota bacterium]